MRVTVKIETKPTSHAATPPFFVARTDDGDWHSYGEVSRRPKQMPVGFFLYGSEVESETDHGDGTWTIKLED